VAWRPSSLKNASRKYREPDAQDDRQALAESKFTSPHFYLTIEIDMSRAHPGA
jgi:hypothetical protein